MSNPIQLLPCPFCGSTIAPHVIQMDRDTFSVTCVFNHFKGCGSKSGTRLSQDAAALLWNSRKLALYDE